MSLYFYNSPFKISFCVVLIYTLNVDWNKKECKGIESYVTWQIIWALEDNDGYDKYSIGLIYYSQ